MTPLTPDELRARVAGLSVWRRGDPRAPHKPLLILYALARFQQGQTRLTFTSLEEPLRDLLVTFGPPRANHHPSYPFWRLPADGLWSLDGTDGVIQRRSNSDPTVKSLRKVDPTGCFPDEVQAALRAHPTLIGEIAHTLLDAHFPSSLHDEVLDAVGLDSNADVRFVRRRPRDRALRGAVLPAYGYRCAICGFETRVGTGLVGVDAAHVMWHQAGGLDDVPNGLALCALHHRLLDRGAFTIASAGTRDMVVEVSETAHGGPGFERWLLDFHGRPIARPVSSSYQVAEPSVVWHRREVFRGPARERVDE